MGSDSNVRHHRPPEITWDLGCKVGSLLLMVYLWVLYVLESNKLVL